MEKVIVKLIRVHLNLIEQELRAIHDQDLQMIAILEEVLLQQKELEVEAAR